MQTTTISDAVRYIGADDTTIDLFESQYEVPNGVSYNSYVILDEKIAVMDTVDARKTDEWLSNLTKCRLSDRFPFRTGSFRRDQAVYRAVPTGKACYECKGKSHAATVF